MKVFKYVLVSLLVAVLGAVVWFYYWVGEDFYSKIDLPNHFQKFGGHEYYENVNTFNHHIWDHQLYYLFEQTIDLNGDPSKLFYCSDDIGYPSVLALWVNGSKYRSVSLYKANDNSGITWRIEKGEFRKRENWNYIEISNWEDYKPF